MFLYRYRSVPLSSGLNGGNGATEENVSHAPRRAETRRTDRTRAFDRNCDRALLSGGDSRYWHRHHGRVVGRVEIFTLSDLFFQGRVDRGLRRGAESPVL